MTIAYHLEETNSGYWWLNNYRSKGIGYIAHLGMIVHHKDSLAAPLEPHLTDGLWLHRPSAYDEYLP